MIRRLPRIFAALAALAFAPLAQAADYYNRTGSESGNSSSISGANVSGDPIGWATAPGGSQALAGITAGDSTYHITTEFNCRSGTEAYATPSSSSIIVHDDVLWYILGKQNNYAIALNNVSVGNRATVHYFNNGNNGNGALAGSFQMASGATLQISGRYIVNDSRGMVLSASVAGSGAIVACRFDNDAQYNNNTVAHFISGNISSFTGDIVAYDYGTCNTLSLELVNAISIPGDPVADAMSKVVVTNSATLKIDNDWTSPTNRVWIFGDKGKPTIHVASDKTVTIKGDIVGSVGFTKTGAGTLAIRGASPDFSGDVTISAGTVQLVGDAAALADKAATTWTEAGGMLEVIPDAPVEYTDFAVSPIPAQTVTSVTELMSGVWPSVIVSNLDISAALVLGTDYTVAYSGNNLPGSGRVTVTGIGDYAGRMSVVSFVIATSGIASYYNVENASREGQSSSSISGDNSPSGWSIARGGGMSINGITAENSIYYVWRDVSHRSPDNKGCTTPASSAIVVEPGVTWNIFGKSGSNTLTLNNLRLLPGAVFAYDLNNVTADLDERTTIGGSITMEESSSLIFTGYGRNDQMDVREITLSASVTGTGLVMTYLSQASVMDVTQKITGDITGFTGDLGVRGLGDASGAFVLELVNACSVPGDPAPGDVAYVVVTNGATLKVDHDWTSGASRVWDFGNGARPTVCVEAGKTVTVTGAVTGTSGFEKTGEGTLVLSGRLNGLSGTVKVSAGTLCLPNESRCEMFTVDVAEGATVVYARAPGIRIFLR